MHNIYSNVAPHGIVMNHHGVGMDIADKEFPYPSPGSKASPLLHHKKLVLDNRDHYSTIFS